MQISQFTSSAVRCCEIAPIHIRWFATPIWPPHLLGQDVHGLLVFGVAQVDAVDGQDGVAHVEPTATLSRLSGMDLRDQDGHPMLLTSLKNADI